MKKKLLFMFFISLFVLSFTEEKKTEFPYREKYPDSPPISITDLKTDYDSGKVLIVDVRSSIEFQVIHTKGSVHIPISKKSFDTDIKKLRTENPDKKIAFYCNGITCVKSYVATKKAIDAGLKNVYAFDDGIPAWAENYPKETLLLGKEVVDPKKQLIPKSELKKISLSYEDFLAKSKEEGVITIDVRDFIQKTGKLPGLGKTKNIPLDKFIPNFVEKKLEQDKTLLIFDQVGKQVRWLMYYLVENNYKNYYFLNKGATGVLKNQEYKK